MIALVVPLRDRDPDRARAWSWCERRWRAILPDVRIATADCPTPEWSKTRALNEAISRLDPRTRLVICADADVVAREALPHRLPLGAWGTPCSRLVRLEPDETERLLAGDPAATLESRHPREGRLKPGWGLFAMPYDAWVELGGFDERFEGWGGEDDWFRVVLTRLCGEPVVGGALLHHLWHPRQPDRKGERWVRNRAILSEARRGG